MATEKSFLTRKLISLAEHGLLPDPLLRSGIRKLLRQRLGEMHAAYDPSPLDYMHSFCESLSASAVAEHTEEANEQHYEVPTEFYKLVLGPHMKYSSCIYPTGEESLEIAEEEMLRLTAHRAGLSQGQQILELGCGWGSLTLHMAENYPESRITAVSNSATQADHIRSVAEKRGFTNVTVVTCDVNSFEPDNCFDRIVSVEMFEHVRNYPQLFNRLKNWLNEDGLVFIHIFCHKLIPYLFEANSDSDWMSRYFFTGGTMPSHELFEQVQNDLTLDTAWEVNGLHYAKTLRSWLDTMDQRKPEVMQVLGEHYGGNEAKVWFNRWRIFFMACEELFAFNKGTEWGVSHYLFSKAA